MDGCACACSAPSFFLPPLSRFVIPWPTHPTHPLSPSPPNTTPNIQRDIVPKDLVGQLGKAEKVLASGLDCAVDPEEENEVGKRVECR